MLLRVGAVLGLLAVAACASEESVTPMIAISPGARERIMVMDRLRHHGSPKRLLPRVTVEEVDDVEVMAASPDDEPDAGAATVRSERAP